MVHSQEGSGCQVPRPQTLKLVPHTSGIRLNLQQQALGHSVFGVMLFLMVIDWLKFPFSCLDPGKCPDTFQTSLIFKEHLASLGRDADTSRAWRFKPLILTSGELRQEKYCKFEANKSHCAFWAKLGLKKPG